MIRIGKINTNFGNQHGDVFTLGETVMGKIFFFPNQDLAVRHVGYRFVLETKGALSTSSKVLFTKHFLKGEKLLKNKEYCIDVDFIYNQVQTYKGRKVDIITRLEFFVVVEGDIIDTQTSKIGKLVNAFREKKPFTESIYLNFIPKNHFYLVNSSSSELDSENMNASIIMGFFVVLFLSLFCVQFGVSAKLVLMIDGALFLLFISYFIFMSILGRLSVVYQNIEDDRFTVKIKSNKNWKGVSKILVNYSVNEETIDRRGTSTHTVVSKIFESKTKSKQEPDNDHSFEFFFPEGMPVTFELGDSRIYWVVRLKVYLRIGLYFVYKDEFEVKMNDSTLPSKADNVFKN